MTAAWSHLPNAGLIDALIARMKTLTPKEAQAVAALVAARDAARDAALVAARGAARGAARDAARGAAWDAARDAALVAARGPAWGTALGAASALIAWDDVPAFIALDCAELEALCSIADGTDTAHKALLALEYKALMGET